MGINKNKKILDIKKEVGISQRLWNSILASFNVYKKKHGYDTEGWIEYYLGRKRRNRAKELQDWVSKDKNRTIKLLSAICSYYEGIGENPKEEGINYTEYLGSSDWKERRDKFIAERRECVLCGAKKRLLVHHLRYFDKDGKSILGKEKPEDLLVMCWECHDLMHEKYGRGASFGMKEIEKEIEDENATFLIILVDGTIIPIKGRDGVILFMNTNEEFIEFGDIFIARRNIVAFMREEFYRDLLKYKENLIKEN